MGENAVSPRLSTRVDNKDDWVQVGGRTFESKGHPFTGSRYAPDSSNRLGLRDTVKVSTCPLSPDRLVVWGGEGVRLGQVTLRWDLGYDPDCFSLRVTALPTGTLLPFQDPESFQRSEPNLYY